mmetsp:Transcript_116876/g.184871  ORF Transcript_116876/g.184871 Transcript_116876/m.184871 type:complete len:820 (-) Transcript_116876:41-2500(-)
MALATSFGDDSPSSEKRKWCDHESVLDLNITDAQLLPCKLPVTRYLKEVTLGLQGGEADSRTQADLRRGAQTQLAHNVEELSKLLDSESDVAVPVCSALFWMAIGIIFGRMHSDILGDFRNQLAQSWYLMCLEGQSQILHREVRDWALAALPFLFAQAIYRMLCDAFEDDRKHFVGQAEKLLDKLSLVVHFEVTGFQITPETVRKARKKLFLRHVLHNPQLDLFQSEEAKKRQEMLESKNANTQDRPLAFGQKDGQALEDTQLEHVMQGRAERVRGRTSSAMSGTPSSHATNRDLLRRSSCEAVVQRGWEPHEDLSVERYEKLSGNGEAMWGRHMNELSQILGQDAEDDQTIPSISPEQTEEPIDECDFEFDPPSTSSSPKAVEGKSLVLATSPPSSPLLKSRASASASSPVTRSTPAAAAGFSMASTSLVALQRSTVEHQAPRMITIAGKKVTWPAKSPLVKRSPSVTVWKTQSSSGSPPTEKKLDAAGEPKSLTMQLPNKRKNVVKKSQSVGKLATVWMNNTKERKEIDAKKKRIRQEVLQRKILAESLPQELCEHELVTTWVSPVMTRLAAEDDRWSVLKKTRAESRQCKMQVFSMDDGASPCNSDRASSSNRVGTAPGRSRATASTDESGFQTTAGTEASRISSRGSRRPQKTASWSPLLGSLEQDITSSVGEGRSRQGADGRQRALTDEKGNLIARTSSSPEVRAVGGSRSLVLPNKALPRVASTGSIAGLSAPLTLEPPSSLSTSVVLNRIEAQGSAFRQTTFAEYVKENDIFTGDAKLRLDEKRLRTEEDAVLRKTDALVGGAAKRLLHRRK